MRGLAAQRLLPGESAYVEFRPIECLGEGGGGRVADAEAAAIGGNPIGIGNTHARSSAVPGKHDVACRIDFAEVGKVAVIGLEQSYVLEFQLLSNVADPALAERFPRQHSDRIRSKQRPQRHLDGAGIGSRHNANAIVSRNLKNFAGEIDGALELRLAGCGAVRASEKGAAEGV